MTTTTLKLASGDELPAVGLGFWKAEKSVIDSLVVEAARCGYRHFDCASDYGNEPEVGRGLQKVLSGGNRRDELWVTSKLWNTNHRRQHVRAACERSLHDLQLEYLDLYLIHFPIALEYIAPETRYPAGWIFDESAAQPKMKAVSVPISETWQAMEELVDAGLVRNIGVSNFGVALLRDLLAHARIRPAVLQVEMHPYLAQEKLVRFCREESVAITAFSPLGAASYFQIGMANAGEAVLEQAVVRDIAEQHGKSPAQIVLRWGGQRGTAVIPKTNRPERLRENLAIFDFELSKDEMDAISALDCNRRFNDPGVFCEQAFNTFFPIYE